MIPLDTFALEPSSASSLEEQAREALRALLGGGAAAALRASRVLSLTWFLDATRPGPYRAGRDLLLGLVRDGWPGGLAPPASVVAQPPEGTAVSLEATVLPLGIEGVTITRREAGGVAYSLVEGSSGRQVYAGGIASADASEDPEAQSHEVFAGMEAVLAAERMTYGHVVRQWNYIEHMLEPGAVGPTDSQRYQIFNDVRTLSYGRADFPVGYPAATGIGQATGGIHVEFIALDPAPGVEVHPISNPQQIDAHCYSTDVLVGRPAGQLPERTSPKFERAKRIAWDGGEIVFISGTASIVGEQSVGLGDPVEQTRTTLGHIHALLGGEPPTYLRAYVKHARDIPAVRQVCEETCRGTPVTYVEADVCRGELLVEIEGLRVVAVA